VQETVAPALTAWGSYYVIIGSSAAALTGLMFVVITLVFAATATHHNIDPFAKHLTPDQRDATITAFRAGILASIGLCIAGSVVAFVWLPKAGESHR